MYHNYNKNTKSVCSNHNLLYTRNIPFANNNQVVDLPYIIPPAYTCAQSLLTLCNPQTIAHQAPLSMGFPRQEYWSGLPCPSPGDLHDPGIEPLHLTSPALTGRSFTTSTKKRVNYMTSKILLDSEIPLTYNCLAHRKHVHTGSLGEK